MKTCPKTGSVHPRESIKHWIGVTAEDIPQGWMDDMVKRLFEILNRDMIRLEKSQLAESDKKGPDDKPPELDLEKAAKKARALSNMQHTLEKLTDMEMRRAEERKAEVTVSDEDALSELERRIDQLADEADASEDSKGTVS
jgi:hypothetical protein